MRKLMCSLFIAGTLMAAPQAVVFDWGNVLAFEDRTVVVDFMCETFQFSEADFEKANLEKRKAVKEGKSDVEFWLQFAKQKGVDLEDQWPASYQAALKKSVGADEEMLALVSELKKNQISVGLLSNINDKYTKLIRDFGFYEPFDPCLLSCEMGLEKPDPKAYELLLEKLDLLAKDVVFIDDKEENIEAAKKLGIDAIVFKSAEQVRSELVKRGLVRHMEHPKVTVYVKHYLTAEGIDYFQNRWFPRVYAILAKQKGFVSISQEKGAVDCMNITLKFKDEETFDAWVTHPSHDDLVNALDAYRSRDYWEAVRTQEEQIDPSTLEWMVIKPK